MVAHDTLPNDTSKTTEALQLKALKTATLEGPKTLDTCKPNPVARSQQLHGGLNLCLGTCILFSADRATSRLGMFAGCRS